MKKSLFLAAQVFCLLPFLVFNAGAQPLPQIKLQQVYANLPLDARPLWMSEAPDGSGRMFIVKQTGTIYVMKKGSNGSDAKEFLNIESRNPNFENEDGLLSMAFHPGFKTNGLFYIYYTQENSDNQHSQPQNYPYRSVVSEMKVSSTNLNKADISSERIVMQIPQPYWNHKGGELCFGPDGYLYLGLGDGGPPSGHDPFGNGQNTATLLAKMLRIDVNSRGLTGRGFQQQELQYGIPSDNPFANFPDLEETLVRPEIFAYGLRNPWRYSFDRKTGDLWVGDVGQDLWEAVYLVTNGGNYGWSVVESGHPLKPGPVGAQYIKPVMDYTHRPELQSQGLFPDHSIGLCIIGGYVYRGKKYPSLDGVYIYGDYNLGTIWGFRYDRGAHKVTAEGTLLQQGNNITSFAEDQDGEVYVLTQDGEIFQITAP